ncbi:MAG: class I SAM-dependent methyltransferase [Deltaproteobacteria bacterium]|nr:class I SAM-dependent methyltransferase [Deltaproteobacteria bacterium]MBI3389746.1 class I SAM-dependent methyltransferase [Deltaproteobacteria bacterium]
MALQQPDEIKGYYRDREVVARYIERRTAQPLNGALHQAQVRFLRQLVAERAPRCVLEIAPGPARLTAEVPVPGLGVGLEFSEGMLAAARARIDARAGWRFVRTDAFHLPVRDGGADLVFTVRFIRRFHLADRQRLYAEIHRALRPGGALVLDAQNRAVALPHREARGLDRYPVYDELYDRPQLEAELHAAGFRVERVEGLIRHARVQRSLNQLRRFHLAGVARALIDAVELVPSANPSTWLVLCEKAA